MIEGITMDGGISLSGILEAGGWVLSVVLTIYGVLAKTQNKKLRDRVGKLYVVADAVMYGVKQGVERFGEGKTLRAIQKRAEDKGCKIDVKEIAIDLGQHTSYRNLKQTITPTSTAAARVSDN